MNSKIINRVSAIICSLLLCAFVSACGGAVTEQPSTEQTPTDQTQTEQVPTKDVDAPSKEEKDEENNRDNVMSNTLILQIGNKQIEIELADNATAKEIATWLSKGEQTLSASNYGGFEKIVALGKSFSKSDKQTTTTYGDVMLYSGNQMVIFYESNSWAYTRIGKVVGDGLDRLESILSGNESQVTLKLK